MIGAGIKRVRETTKARGGSAGSNQGFYEFMTEVKSEIFYRYSTDSFDPIQEFDVTFSQQHLDRWYKNNRLTYLASWLKYEMKLLPVCNEDQSAKGTDGHGFNQKQVMLVLDDLEGIKNVRERNQLSQCLEPIFMCLKNGVDFPTKIIVSHRPHTRDEFLKNNISTIKTIEFKSDLTLRRLIQVRAEKYLQHSPEAADMTRRATWESSYRSLWSLLTRYSDSEKSEIILSSSNYSFRESQFKLTNILQSVAVEGSLSETEGGSFVFDTSGWPHISRPSLVEILGRRGHLTYTADKDNGVVNLFENEPTNADADYLIFLLMHWCWNFTKSFSSQWPRLVDVSNFKNLMDQTLPGNGISSKVDWAIQKCADNGLLEKAGNGIDAAVEYYHLMPRADFLYTEVADNAALINMWVSDTYLSEENLSNFRSDVNNNRHIFLSSIRFLNLLQQWELSLHKRLTNKKVFWELVLNGKSLSMHVHKGMAATFNRWTDNPPKDAPMELEKSAQLIRKLEYDYQH